MDFDVHTQCWIWLGGTSPSNNPVHRRKSVWRHLYSELCGSVKALPRLIPPTCERRMCVNPDHRVPPESRQPKFHCPTCGQISDVEWVGGEPRTERKPLVYQSVRRQIEEQAAAEGLTEPLPPRLKHDEFDSRTGLRRSGGKYTLEEYEQDGGPEDEGPDVGYLPSGVWAWDEEEGDKLLLMHDESVWFFRKLSSEQRAEWLRLGPRGRTEVQLPELDKYTQ